MFVNGSFIVPVGRPLPYIGEVKMAKGKDGEIRPIVVKEIVGLEWIKEGMLNVNMVVETNVSRNDRKEITKARLLVLPGQRKVNGKKKDNIC